MQKIKLTIKYFGVNDINECLLTGGFMNIKMILFVLIINVIGCADIIVFGNNNENIHVFISSFFCLVIVHSILFFPLYIIHQLNKLGE